MNVMVFENIQGTILVQEGSSINNFGTFNMQSGSLTLSCCNTIFNNRGIFTTDDATIDVNEGSTFNNFDSFTLNDPSFVDIEGRFTNTGTVNNNSFDTFRTDVNGNLVNEIGGIWIQNDGNLQVQENAIFTNRGTLTNNGESQLRVTEGADVFNFGTINNNDESLIELFSGTFDNEVGGTINNNAKMNFFNEHENEGTINNLSGGVIYIDDDENFEIRSTGVVNNDGVINVRGGLQLEDSGTVLNNNKNGVIDISGIVSPEGLVGQAVDVGSHNDITTENEGTN